MIETTYVSFRKAIELMVLNNTCQCNACANVSTLDLKFFVHHGIFGLQRLGEHDELVGSDVNLIHRLLKNHVTETTGCRAYTLYTEAAIRHMGLEEISANMTPHVEAYEHLGEVKTWVQDMHPVWEQKRTAARVAIPPGRIASQVEAQLAMPPHLVWDYLVQPEFRKTLMGSDSQRVLNRSHGRVTPGSAYQCFHGKRVVIQTILDWQPFAHLTTEDLAMPNTTVLVNYRLIPTEIGTRLVETFSKARGPLLNRLVGNAVLAMMAKSSQKRINAFKQRIEADLAARGTPQAAAEISSEEINEAAAASLADTRTQ